MKRVKSSKPDEFRLPSMQLEFRVDSAAITPGLPVEVMPFLADNFNVELICFLLGEFNDPKECLRRSVARGISIYLWTLAYA